MALVTSQSTLPDFEYEHHTVILDNLDTTSDTDFTLHLPTPLENVVQAQLLAASINEYPIIQQYYNPIRKLDRVTFNLDDQAGDTLLCGDAIFVFKFVCKKKNLSY